MPIKWITRGLKKGIMTTKYPKKKPTKDEVPNIGVPIPTENIDIESAQEICPTNAIDEVIDVYRCIFCMRCEAHGFKMSRDIEFAEVRKKLSFQKSIHIFVVDVGSCNACNRELGMLNNPFYDFQRLGLFFTPSPRHADVMLVIGYLTEKMLKPMLEAYDAMPNPKIIVTAGSCAVSGGIFGDDGVEKHIIVDAKIPGCPPSPIALIHGLLKISGRV